MITNQEIASVSQVNRYVKNLLDNDVNLENIWIKGEISNFKHHYTGHMYFTLKDKDSIIKCVMFKGYNSKLLFKPENGMKVIIRANVSVYERDGAYQCYILEMTEYGLGNLHIEFEKLKQKLLGQGYFDESHKKKIPYLPKEIVVLTSQTGAVIKDIINVLTRRYNNFRLKLLPIPVQGKNAAPNIARAIDLANQKKLGDVIILARGGGSLEELWAFNEEVVANSIYKSEIPIISAIGHETDFTISDFVADLRAPTPSAAAELVMPKKVNLTNQIADINIRMKNAVLNSINLNKNKLQMLNNRAVFKRPLDNINQKRLQVDEQSKYLKRNIEETLNKRKLLLKALIGKVDVLSPLGVLARGYSVVQEKDTNKVISSVSEVKIGEEVVVTVNDGNIYCKVDEIKHNKEV